MFEKLRLFLTRIFLTGLPLFPISAAVGFCLSNRRLSFSLAWGTVFFGFYGLLILNKVISLEFRSVLWLILYGLGSFILSALLVSKQTFVSRAFFTAIILFICAIILEFLLSAFVWRPYVPSQVTWSPLGVTIEGVSDQEVAYRQWRLGKNQGDLGLSLEVKRTSGQMGWEWQRSNLDLTVSYLKEHNQTFTRLVYPDHDDPFVSRNVYTGEAIAKRMFRTSLKLRAQQNGACGTLYLSEQGASNTSAKDICLSQAWQTFEHSWTPPQQAQGSRISVILNDFDGQSIDVTDFKLEIFQDDQWQSFSHVSPVGMGISTLYQDHHLMAKDLRILPTDTWQTYHFNLEKSALEPRSLRLNLQVEKGLEVQIRNVSLYAVDPLKIDPTPLPSRNRAALWFGHPNLLGHSLAVSSLVFITSVSSYPLALIGAVLSITGIFFTGSRAALLAALLGLSILGGIRFGKLLSYKGPLIAVSILGLLAFLLFNPTIPQRLNNALSRFDIWQVAWKLFLDHPWTGIGENNFSLYWQKMMPQSQELITHAHNLWLEFAVSYGILGLFAMIWLSAGFIYLAWKWGKLQGLGLIIPIFIMNLFDYTFFFPGVFFPLILGMNLIRHGKNSAPRRSHH